MQMYEINTLLSNSYLKIKDNWEQARFIAYLIAQTNSKKKLKMTDILTFGWEDNKEHIKSISNTDVDRLRNRAKQIEKLYER